MKVDSAPHPQTSVTKKHYSRPTPDTRLMGPGPRPQQHALMNRDRAPFTTSGMPSDGSMNLQTAVKRHIRRSAGLPRHVLLTFLNENPCQLLACQRGPVVPHSPGNWRFLASVEACWHEVPGFLLAAGSSPARGTIWL